MINFTNPEKLKEIAWYDIAGDNFLGSSNWSAYPYVGPDIRGRNGIRSSAADGVHNPPTGRGFVTFRATCGAQDDARPPQPADDGLRRSAPDLERAAAERRPLFLSG